MYAVFTNTILTDKGKYLFRQHEGDYNAHSIHKELLAHILTSTKASLESSILITYITTSKFGTGAWNDSSESFILHWQKQVSEYEKLAQNADTLSNTIKKSILENAVDELTELRNIKTIATQLQATTGTVITYDGYVSLLYSTAQSYDK